MAKKNRNNHGGQPGVAAIPLQHAVNRSQPEKLIPAWVASFDTLSIVSQPLNATLDIEVDEVFLKSLIDGIRDDDSKKFASWIERFAEICKDLGKYKDQLQDEYEARAEQARHAGQALNDKERQLVERQAEVDRRQRGIEQLQDELEPEKVRQAEKNSDLLNREREMKYRELNAETGFAEQNKQALEALEVRQRLLAEDHKVQLDQLYADKRKLEDEIRQSARQLADIKYKCSDEEAARMQSLDDREHELDQVKRDLDRDRSRLDREWSDLNEAKLGQQQHIASEMSLERQAHAKEVEGLKIKHESTLSKVQGLKVQLADLHELKAHLGEHSAAEILEQLDRLREENRNLRKDLNLSDAAELQSENDSLRSRFADLEREIADIRPERDRALRELSVQRVSATELEAVAREKRVLEQHKNILTVHIDDLESRIDLLTNAQKTQTPFPAMSQMDSDKECRSSIVLEEVPSLDRFAEELQHRIAQAEKQVKLYYPLEDIRVLLGGLAMSQLHVFQGISGTGKTSLAKAFAKAMGGLCTDIAVQAGWRDRDDLLGHYNAFERRFYEKDCLQALYKAQTSRWQDTCNVILLDEMNLSRPEQYFAEFLSALEKNDTGERLISLSETALPNAPAMLREGRQIQVPANIWFIGTANHDETTNELADKTYDRAHVMTLPKQDHRFDIKPMASVSFSFSSLQKAFDKACIAHQDAVRDLLANLTSDDFTEQLGSHFDGWGNRFEKQALRFIPVMMAAGAASGEALDHLLSTRVMRPGKVTGRYDVAAGDVRKLKDALEHFWTRARLDGCPDKSLKLLESDIKRKEGGI